MVGYFNIKSAILWIVGFVFLSMTPIKAYGMEDKLKHFTLPNGLAVFVKEDHARKVATIQIWVHLSTFLQRTRLKEPCEDGKIPSGSRPRGP